MSSYSEYSRSEEEAEEYSIFPRLCNSCRQLQPASSKIIICLHNIRPIKACHSEISTLHSGPSRYVSISSTSETKSKSTDESESVVYVGDVCKSGALKGFSSESGLSSPHARKNGQIAQNGQTSKNPEVTFPFTFVQNENALSGVEKSHSSLASSRNELQNSEPNNSAFSGGNNARNGGKRTIPLPSIRNSQMDSFSSVTTSRIEGVVLRTCNYERPAYVSSGAVRTEKRFSLTGRNEQHSTTSSSFSLPKSNTCAKCKQSGENTTGRRIICLHNHRSIRAYPAELQSQDSSDSIAAPVPSNERCSSPNNLSWAFSNSTRTDSSGDDCTAQNNENGLSKLRDDKSYPCSDSVQSTSLKGPCRALSNMEIFEVQKALQGGREKEFIRNACLYGTTLRPSELKSLCGSRWVTDEIMNAFIVLLNARNQTYFGTSSDDISRHKLSSHTSQKKVPSGRDTFHGVRKVSRMSTVLQRSESSCSIQTRISKKRAFCFNSMEPKTEIIFDSAVEEISSPQLGFSRPRTHAFNTFFIQILSKPTYVYERVQRWMERTGKDVLSQDLLLFPVNLNNSHWVLAAIDLKQRSFLYFDSLHRADRAGILPLLRRWLLDEVRNVHGQDVVELLRIETWREELNPKYAPRQYDSGSCGVFTLFVAEHLERGVQPLFSQQSIGTLRNRTILILLGGHLPDY